MRRAGFTLLEVTLSTFLVTLMVVVTITLAPDTLLRLRAGDQRLGALRLAGNQLNAAWAQPIAGISPANLTVSFNGASYQVVRQVLPEGDQAVRVQVTVTWSEQGQTRSLTRERTLANVPRT